MNGAPNEVTQEDPRDRRNRLRRELYARRAMERIQDNSTGVDVEEARASRNHLDRERSVRRTLEQRQVNSGEERDRRNRHARERCARRTAEQRQADISVSYVIHTSLHLKINVF